ncbi:MAG: hypothetical protein HY553_12525, partial [Elusimicrobia bacterium]|nr:hypothetical protein [Elusimicrobiota bacterium]
AKVITREQAELGAARYLETAGRLAGRRMSREDLEALPAFPGAGALTPLQRFAGLVTFVNVLWALGIGLGVVCFSFLFGSYVEELMVLLKEVPLVVYEAVFHLLAAAFLVGGKFLPSGAAAYVGLTGCLLFAAAVCFSAMVRRWNGNPARLALLLYAVWGGAAMLYQSPMIGFLAVAALLSAFGFMVAMGSLCYFIGFENDAAVGRGTVAAFVVLILHVALRITGESLPLLGVFERGGLFLGSFVGYLGLLILSSRFYDGRAIGYLGAQVVTVAAGLLALFVGNVFSIPELSRIGGTFFVLYLLEKPVEIPASSKRGYAAVGLAVSAAVYAFCLYVKANPDALRPYLFLFD